MWQSKERLFQQLREGTHGGQLRTDQKPDGRGGSSSYLSFEIYLAAIRTNRRGEIPDTRAKSRFRNRASGTAADGLLEA